MKFAVFRDVMLCALSREVGSCWRNLLHPTSDCKMPVIKNVGKYLGAKYEPVGWCDCIGISYLESD
jgi:hypothetical protein